MATTTTAFGIAQLKGPSNGDNNRIIEIPLRVTGGYLAAGRPSVDILAEVQKQHQGCSAVSVSNVALFRAPNGSNAVNCPNAQIVLSGTGNKVATFQLASTGTNGAAGTEVVDAVVVDVQLSLSVTLVETLS